MDIVLEIIDIKNKELLHNLMQLYLHDITKDFPIGIDLDENCLFSYSDFNKYWQNKAYIPYFIKLENKIIGFVLINDDFEILEKGNNTFNLSEIFVINKHKRKGVGKQVMIQLFSKFRGKWEVRAIPNSKQAELFWDKIIKEYTQNNYNVNYTGYYNRPIFTFDTSGGE